MYRQVIPVFVLFAGLLSPSAANAWFFFFPGGAIQRALEVDPDSIAVSSGDRGLGQCAGYHVNQATKGKSGGERYDRETGGPPPPTTQTPESKFHSDMADTVLQRASEKDKVKSLAEAYSVRWGRVAAADLQANRQYGATLARGCMENDMPLRYVDFPAWQARQEDKKRQQAEDERKRIQADEEKKRVRAEEVARSQSKVGDTASTEQKTAPSTAGSSGMDYIAEAKKSALILGCPTSDVKVTGAEKNNILMSANCGAGKELLLTCDQSGVCLRR